MYRRVYAHFETVQQDHQHFLFFFQQKINLKKPRKNIFNFMRGFQSCERLSGFLVRKKYLRTLHLGKLNGWDRWESIE